MIFAGDNVTANAVRPGPCKTEFFRNYLNPPAIVKAILSVIFFPILTLCRSSVSVTVTHKKTVMTDWLAEWITWVADLHGWLIYMGVGEWLLNQWLGLTGSLRFMADWATNRPTDWLANWLSYMGGWVTWVAEWSCYQTTQSGLQTV